MGQSMLTLTANPLVQLAQTEPVTPHNPQNTREDEALGLEGGVSLSAMGWEKVCHLQE